MAGRSAGADLVDDAENDVFRCDAVREFPVNADQKIFRGRLL